MRREELFQLRREDVLWPEGVLIVRAVVSKTRTRRVVPIHPDIVAALERRCALPRFWPWADARNAWRAFKQAAARAGLDPGVRLHDIRHTWASAALRDGLSSKAVQEIGGWSTERMLRRYGAGSHADAAILRAELNRMRSFVPQV